LAAVRSAAETAEITGRSDGDRLRTENRTDYLFLLEQERQMSVFSDFTGTFRRAAAERLFDRGPAQARTRRSSGRSRARPHPLNLESLEGRVVLSTVLTSSSATLLGTWSRTASGGYNKEAYYTHAAGTGADTASWQFTGLAPGMTDYLALTWPASSNRATNTPWTVYDSNGTTVLGSGTINQQQVPVGPQAGGVSFQWFVGGFTPTGTSLTITISDNASGSVAADAAYLAPASVPGLVCSALASGNWSAAATWAPYQPCVPYAITNCVSDGGQIEITTATANNWLTGNTINILGVQGTTEANGAWTITAVDPTDAVLQGSSFVNSYTGGGSAFRGDSVAIGSGVALVLDAAACDSNGLIVVGSDPNTGGTVAVAWAPTVLAATSLTVNPGLALRLRGDLTMVGDANAPYYYGTLTLGTGSSLIFDPPSGQTYVWNYKYSVNVTCNGTSGVGNHVTVKTDLSRGGNPAYTVIYNGVPTAGQVWGGLVNVAYTDFSNFGDSTHNGLWTYLRTDLYTHSDGISVTNSTFSACSYWVLTEFSTIWHGNFVFSNNVATHSVPSSQVTGGGPWAWGFTISGMPTGEIRQIENNTFDTMFLFDHLTNVVVTGNVFAGGIARANAPSWANDSYFNNNVVVIPTSASINFPMYPIRDCYFLDTAASPGGFLLMAAGTSVTGCVFEASGTGGNGFIIQPMGALTIKECFVLPAPNGKGSGYLIYPAAHGPIIAEHNLVFGGTSYGMIALGRGGAATVGEVASVQSNIIYGSSVSNYTLAISEFGGSSTYTLDAVTLAGYNGFNNPSTGPTQNGGTTNKNSRGYSTIAVSAGGSTTFPNAQIGTGDFTANPGFVDPTYRSFAKWGAATQGANGTYAGALAVLSLNASLIPSMLAWVRAGYAPTNVAYANATYPGDTLTTDANGNPLNGTVGPMAYVSP
jgi:hypothetical protein